MMWCVSENAAISWMVGDDWSPGSNHLNTCRSTSVHFSLNLSVDFNADHTDLLRVIN